MTDWPWALPLVWSLLIFLLSQGPANAAQKGTIRLQTNTRQRRTNWDGAWERLGTIARLGNFCFGRLKRAFGYLLAMMAVVTTWA